MASWQQVAAITATTGSILLNRVAPEYRYHDSTWQTGAVLWVAQAFAFLLYRWILYPLYLSPLLRLPQPSGANFLMGHFTTIIKEPSGEPMRMWAETVKNDGLIHYRTALNAGRVMCTSPKSLAEVLTVNSYDFVKPEQIRYNLGRILGVGILLAEGDEHKRQRKHLTPAFAFRRVKDLYPVFISKSVEMVQAMKAAIDKAAASPAAGASGEKAEAKVGASNVVEVNEWVSRGTLDIIGKAGLGRDFNAVEDPSNELYQTYQRIFKPTRTARALAILGFIFPQWLIRSLPIKPNDDMKKASSVIRATAHDLIQHKKAAMEKAGAAGGEGESADLLSIALSSGGFTDDNLVDQLMTFLAAGHETTASSMNWVILHLCRMPELQARLRAELRAAGFVSAFVAPEALSEVSAADLDRAPLLAAVCNETLRVNPPVAMTLRQAARDTSILGTPIPKGTTVILSPAVINRSTELWGPDAAEFKPERWLGPGRANSGGASSNYAFMTFIHGPRSCIGMGFAKAEFMCMVAAWVASFETELEDPERKIEVAGGVTQKPKGGLRVKLTPVTS